MVLYYYFGLGFLLIVMIFLYLNKNKPVVDWCKHKAVFYNKSGIPVGYVTIKYGKSYFEYKRRTYNFKPRDSSYVKHKGLIGSVKYYLYDLDNPDPLVISNNIRPFLDPKVYTAVVENDFIKKIASFSDNPLLSLLKDKKFLIILLIVIASIIYFSSGGSLT